MDFLRHLFRNHPIDDWASEQILIAGKVLNQLAAELIMVAEPIIVSQGLKNSLIRPNALIDKEIAPLVRNAVEPVVAALFDSANAALRLLADCEAVFTTAPGHHQDTPSHFEGTAEVAWAVVPIASGAAVAAGLPFAAVTTTTAWFGLGAATTVISWPILVGGSALAALGVAYGGVRGLQLPDRVYAHSRRRVRDFIVTAVMHGTAEAPSIFQQVEAEILRAAKEAKSL